MGLRRGRYAQVMLRSYGPYADTGDVFALDNPKFHPFDTTMKMAGLMGAFLIGRYAISQKATVDSLSVGALVMGASLFYFGSKTQRG